MLPFVRSVASVLNGLTKSVLSISVLLTLAQSMAQNAVLAADETEEQAIRNAWSEIYLSIAKEAEFEMKGVGKMDVKLIERPLLKWHNPVREGETQGDFFVWTVAERPVVVGTIFSYISPLTGKNRVVAVELHALIKESIRFRIKAHNGTLNGSGLNQFDYVVDDSEVATSAVKRLQQMRTWAKECEAFTVADGQDQPLRLLTQPLLLIGEDEKTAQENTSALFGLVTGTDPEVLILIQASETDDDGKSKWVITPARFTDLPFKIQSKGQLVWESSAQNQSEPYFSAHGIAIKPIDPR
jgi:hypothetical protein